MDKAITSFLAVQKVEIDSDVPAVPPVLSNKGLSREPISQKPSQEINLVVVPVYLETRFSHVSRPLRAVQVVVVTFIVDRRFGIRQEVVD